MPKKPWQPSAVQPSRQAHSDCNSANNGHLADLGWIVPGPPLWLVGAMPAMPAMPFFLPKSTTN